LTHKYGLYYSTGKENVKQHRLKEPDKSRYEIYEALKMVIPKCQNWKQLARELDKVGIKTEFKTKGNTSAVEGVKFRKGAYTFNGSKVDRMFSYSKIDYRLKQNARQSMQQEQIQSRSATVHNGTEPVVSGLGGLFDIRPASGQDDNQEYLYRQPKKKKKRRYGRQM
jgi:hypothetical protein